MRRILWAVLFLAVIGVASAAVLVSVNIPGIIRVIRPGLSVSPTDFGIIELTGTGVLTGTAPLTLTNTGDIALTLTWSCACPVGISLSLDPPLGPLAKSGTTGDTWTGTVTITVDSAVVGGDYSISLTIGG